MSRIPVTRKQTTELISRLPVNRAVAASAGRAGARAVGRRLTPAVLRSPSVPGGVEPLPAESKVGANYDTDWARSYPARAARVLVSGDTGPLHLAAAAGTPVVGVYGPTPPGRNGPWDARDEVVSSHDTCACVFKRQCTSSSWCLERITVDAVAGAVVRRLEAA